MSRHKERAQGFRPCSRRETAREHQLLHQLHVRVQWSLCIAGEHVVVHVDGATVVDGVAKSLSHDLHAAIHGQAQLEEARLRCGQGIHTLKYSSQVHVKGFRKHVWDVGKESIPWNTAVRFMLRVSGRSTSEMWARNPYPEIQQSGSC